MNIYDDAQPLYVISIAARMVGLHVQTLRYYERAGLIKPSRSQGNTRFYSARDVAQLVRIKSLIDDLGVNLAGVEVIMRMSQRMIEMQKEMEELREKMKMLMEGRDRPKAARQMDAYSRRRGGQGYGNENG